MATMTLGHVESTYRSLDTETLVQLQTAFQLDRCHVGTEAGRSFCEDRLGLIKQLLDERRGDAARGDRRRRRKLRSIRS